MGLRDVAGAVWRQRLLVLLVLLVVAAAGGAGWWLAPRTWVATTTLQVAENPAVDLTSAGDDPRRAVAALAGSPSVVERASLLAGVDAADDAAQQVRGRWLRPAGLVQVSVEDGDPATAAALAGAVAQVLDDAAPEGALGVSVRGTVVSAQRSGRPEPLLVVLLAGGAGLLLAVAAAVVRDGRTRTVDGGAGVEAATSAPLLAHLRAPLDPAALPALEPGTAGAAAFRGLVASLTSMTSLTSTGPVSTASTVSSGSSRTSGPPRGRVDRLVVAGVGGGEAPAWIAANLGVALAGRCPTLLVDARLGSRFGRPGPGEPDTAGLHEVLLGGDLDDAVSPGPVRGLSVLPSGGWGLEPPPGLVAERFAAVADGARERFRGVVVIAPPLDSSVDARLMAPGAGLLLVVPEHRLVAGELRAHADRVRAAGGRLVGVVLVAAPLVAA